MVTGYRPTPGGGGMEKHVFELVCGLLARGLEVEVICEDRSFLPDPVNELGDRVIGIPTDSLRDLGWVELYEEKSRLFAEALDPDRNDVVHCHRHYGRDIMVQLSGMDQRPALFNTYHLTPVGQLERYRELGIPEPEGAPIDREVAEMEATAARHSDRCIAVSAGVGDEIVRLYDVPQERVRVIYNWYHPGSFGKCPKDMARRLLGWRADGLYLLYIGHFGLHRGRLLLDAMRRLPAEVIMVVIHPEADEAVEAEFGHRVQFLGYLTPERLALYYSASDLQCFPTVYSGFGLVLVEGMACCCPPVVFNYSAMNEIVTPESGYLVNEPTPEAYAAALLEGLNDGGCKAEAATRRADHFQMDPQIDRIAALYKEVIRQRT